MDEPASYSHVSIIHLYCMLPESTRCSLHGAGRLRFGGSPALDPHENPAAARSLAHLLDQATEV